MNEQPTWYVGLPAGEHPISGKLGRYFAATSYIEFSIVLCMGAVLGVGPDFGEASHKLGLRTTIHDKIKRLEVAARKSDQIDEYRRTLVLAACGHLRALNAARNEYAHGVFEHTRTNEVRIHPFGISNGKAGLRIIDPARLEGDILLLDVMLRISQFVAGEISRETLQPHLAQLQKVKMEDRPATDAHNLA